MGVVTVSRVTPFADDLAVLQVSQVVDCLIPRRGERTGDAHDFLSVDQGQVAIRQSFVGWVGHAGSGADDD